MQNQCDLSAKFKILLVQGEADFERHLPVRDLSFFEITARLGYFEPAHVANSLLRARQRILYRLLKPFRGRTDQFDFFVNVISHGCILWRAVRGRQLKY